MITQYSHISSLSFHLLSQHIINYNLDDLN